MKKSTIVLVFGSLVLSGLAWGEENPVRLLPGMRPADRVMPPARIVSSFPQPIISDVTNYPNPFDSRKGGLEGQTEIAYQLAGDYRVSITIYDLFGGKVRVWEYRPGENGGHAGLNTLRWDGTNESGRKVSKGGYLAMIEVDTGTTVATAVRKIGLIH